ncbi:MAG: nuclear transport factor 2 family protein [Candidatus Eremiobacteraeota bacterium]|nr:nuclear transport factor 2 family protein [Candidatus Eremiobacteraeota bacterium]
MNPFAACVLTIALASTIGVRTAALARPAASAAVFRALILERIRAYGRGDLRVYDGMLANGFVHVSDRGERRTRSEMRAFVGHADNHATYDVFDVSYVLDGDLAIVDAVVHERLAGSTHGLRETDVFVSHGDRWLYLRHHETAIVQPPIAAAVGDDRYDDYVGRYRSAAGAIDDITMRGGLLFDRDAPGDAPEPFVHVARGAFGFATTRRSRFSCAILMAALRSACGIFRTELPSSRERCSRRALVDRQATRAGRYGPISHTSGGRRDRAGSRPRNP